MINEYVPQILKKLNVFWVSYLLGFDESRHLEALMARKEVVSYPPEIVLRCYYLVRIVDKFDSTELLLNWLLQTPKSYNPMIRLRTLVSATDGDSLLKGLP